VSKKLVKLERWLAQWRLSFQPVDLQAGEEDAYELINPDTGKVLARLHQKPGKPTVFWEGHWEGAGSGAQRSFVKAAEEVLYCFGFAHGHIGNMTRSGGEW
jgi:hypothetical protein